MDTVLVVDDNQAVCQALSLMLEIAGYRPLSCQSLRRRCTLLSKKRSAW